jgi:molybdopterin converting factor small subunit
MASKVREKYGRRSSENDILNDKCQDLNENLASKEKLIKLLGEKNKSLYNENQQLKKDKIKIEKEKDEALSR